MKTVYERIKEIRKLFKMSQIEFSKKIFITKSFYGDIEIGKKRVNDRILFIISKQFNVNIEWLKTGKSEMFITKPDILKEKLINIYNQLNPSLQNCLVEQSNILLKLQNDKTKKE